MSGPIPHAVLRVCQRVGIRDAKEAEGFLNAAYDYGYDAGCLTSNGPLADYLAQKKRSGNRVMLYKGIVVVFGAYRKAITAYPLPTYLLNEYRRIIEND